MTDAIGPREALGEALRHSFGTYAVMWAEATVCSRTFAVAQHGACPLHGGDNCLIQWRVPQAWLAARGSAEPLALGEALERVIVEVRQWGDDERMKDTPEGYVRFAAYNRAADAFLWLLRGSAEPPPDAPEAGGAQSALVYTKVGVTALVIDEDRVLLGRKGRAFDPSFRGKWVTPGGRVGYGEGLEAAVIREVQEETGLTVTVCEPLPPQELIHPNGHFVFFAYLAEPREGLLRAGDDLDDVRWFTLDEALALDMTPLTQRLVEFWRDVIGGTKAVLHEAAQAALSPKGEASGRSTAAREPGALVETIAELRVYADSLEWTAFGPWDYTIKRERIDALYGCITAVIMAARAAGEPDERSEEAPQLGRSRPEQDAAPEGPAGSATSGGVA
jgi:ADP-ribose pyrophosphatase YjhB (NUDIX family)